MTPDVQELFDAALAVQANAHAPYSGFRVGAAIRGGSGRVYAACNVENAAYPQGSCAEAGAISALVSAGERRIVAVLTVCDGDVLSTCCGGCRQRIREFAAGDTPIHAAGVHGLWASFTLDQLLPASFGPENVNPRGSSDVSPPGGDIAPPTTRGI
jgi:cytidine deaminase